MKRAVVLLCAILWASVAHAGCATFDDGVRAAAKNKIDLVGIVLTHQETLDFSALGVGQLPPDVDHLAFVSLPSIPSAVIVIGYDNRGCFLHDAVISIAPVHERLEKLGIKMVPLVPGSDA